jgi:cytidylate kinase
MPLSKRPSLAEDSILNDKVRLAPVIAVDGPAASGKGTIARALAKRFGLPHMDTGLLYRAVALNLWRCGHATTLASILPTPSSGANRFRRSRR